MVFCIIGDENKDDDFKVYECKSFFSYTVAVDYAYKWVENNKDAFYGEPIVKIFNDCDSVTLHRVFDEKYNDFILKLKKD